jgi:hypothetical protein
VVGGAVVVGGADVVGVGLVVISSCAGWLLLWLPQDHRIVLLVAPTSVYVPDPVTAEVTSALA